MKKILFVFIVFFLSLTFAQTQKYDQTKITTLLQTALDKQFIPGRELIVQLVELQPNTKLERHWHPGEEFHYYLEGEVEIKIGDSTYIGKPGMVGHVPYKAIHTATALDKGAKILVFRVHSEGEPMRYPADSTSNNHK
ncbi:MAG TPA: cupin domain-containing protein [Ignavibacteriaceae bacterium]|nr:cupin domain-containing protein [Ignavibacteriaceae bacterium]